MPSGCNQLMGAFFAGVYGVSVRIKLRESTVRDACDRLTAAGFQRETRPLVAQRSADGQALWRKLDGTTSSNAQDASVVEVDFFVHADGGMVRVFPHGDPLGRLVPTGKPAAIKSVLFHPPRGGAAADTSFQNEAFRVTDDGNALPKSRRAVYGLKFDPRVPVDSYTFADDLQREHIVIPLAKDPVPMARR